jgi:SAM-dependent methyltransferase
MTELILLVGICLEMESLNIGCGSDPWGDVRVDVAFSFITASFKPNVLADAHYLPFKSGAFKVAKASHVLEHLRDPFKALEEMLRVTKSELLLKFPTEWDVLPAFVSNILPFPRFSALKHAHITRKKNFHLWIISPQVILKYLESRGWKSSVSKGKYWSLPIFRKRKKSQVFQMVNQTCQNIMRRARTLLNSWF